jgi:hypothetical protein
MDGLNDRWSHRRPVQPMSVVVALRALADTHPLNILNPGKIVTTT